MTCLSLCACTHTLTAGVYSKQERYAVVHTSTGGRHHEMDSHCPTVVRIRRIPGPCQSCPAPVGPCRGSRLCRCAAPAGDRRNRSGAPVPQTCLDSRLSPLGWPCLRVGPWPVCRGASPPRRLGPGSLG